jgi:hypothetical protein
MAGLRWCEGGSGLRVSSEGLEKSSLGDTRGCIQAEQTDRGKTDRRASFDDIAVELKMIGPAVAPWIEQPNGHAGFRVDRGYVGTLVAIAGDAGIRQICEIGSAAMFAADDAINLMREAGVVLVN